MPDNSHRPLTAIALVCSLERSPSESSSDLMAEHVCEQLRSHDVKTDTLAAARNAAHLASLLRAGPYPAQR